MNSESNSMFCPMCGADGQHANAYCKRCGEWLPKIKKRSRMAFGGETPHENIFTSLFMSALSAAVALFSGIALYATYLGTPEIKWSVYLAAAFCLCIAGWQITSFMAAIKLRRRLGKGREKSAPAQVGPMKQSSLLDPADMTPIVRTSAVTEGTTELLEPVRKVQSERKPQGLN